jgi:hypothetical protein
MSIVRDEPRMYQISTDPPPDPRPPAHGPRLRPAWAAGLALTVLLAILVLGGLQQTFQQPLTDPQPTVQQVIEKADFEQERAVATNDPSVMSDTATPSYFLRLVQANQQMLGQGVVGTELTNLTWGTVSLNGTTASATSYETWVTAFADGTTSESTDTKIYTLVQQDGTWLIESRQQLTPLMAKTVADSTSHN